MKWQFEITIVSNKTSAPFNITSWNKRTNNKIYQRNNQNNKKKNLDLLLFESLNV